MNKNIIKEEDKVHVAILGTCCVRDSIGYFHEGEEFIVDRFVQSINPISLAEESPLLKDLGDMLSLLGTDKKRFTNFYRRNFSLDLNKNALEYVSEADSEWLLIDVACLRTPVIKYKKGMYTDILTELGAQCVFDYLTDNEYLPQEYLKIYPQDLSDNDLFAYLDKFIDKLLKYYPQEKIVLFDIRAAQYCAMSDGTVTVFPTEERYNRVYLGYNYILSKLLKVHVIEFPSNVLGYEKHKWGKYSLHYVREYYDYAYAALEKIVGGGVLFA